MRTTQGLWLAVLVLATVTACRRDAGPRLVVLSPEVANLVDELEVADAVVGADDRSRAVAGVTHAASLGSLGESDVVRARAVAPTLVLGLARDPERRFAAALAVDGVEVELFSPRSMDEVVDALHRLGALVGQPERAQRLAYRTVTDITKIAVRRDGKRRQTVAWVIDHDPLTVVGGSGLLHQLLELAGAENALHNTSDERVVLGASGLTDVRYDTILDATADATRPACRDGTMLCVAPEVAAVPALDVKRRVEVLYARLYPATEPAPPPP